LGTCLIALSLFSTIGAFGWVLGYWDNSLQETYRDHDIYYFPNINVYGVDIGGDSTDWPFNSGLQGCRNMIDSWLDAPQQVETYRDFEIYMIQGFKLYYGVKDATLTSKWAILDNLKEYIDTQFYPTSVKIFTGIQETWTIYRQGYDPVLYWAETEGLKSPTYTDLEKSIQYVEEKLAAENPEIENDQQETPGYQDPLPNGLPDGKSIGEQLNAKREMISMISGLLGLGFIAIGEAERSDHK